MDIPHPIDISTVRGREPTSRRDDPAPYAELVTTSNFSFLRGGSHPEELVVQAAAIGLAGVGICDRNSLAGVVRGFFAMRDVAKDFSDFRYVVGSRLVFSDGTPAVIVYPSDLAAYSVN